MGTALGITRTEHTSADLRALSGRCPDGAQVRRLLALALVLDGHSRGEAAALNGMDRQTLRDWVHRYNAAGIDGLKSRRPPGRRPALTQQQKAELRELVVQGPDPAKDPVVRWRCVDLRGGGCASVWDRRSCAYDRQMAEPVRPDTPATAAVPSEERC
jgi:transposase